MSCREEQYIPPPGQFATLAQNEGPPLEPLGVVLEPPDDVPPWLRLPIFLERVDLDLPRLEWLIELELPVPDPIELDPIDPEPVEPDPMESELVEPDPIVAEPIELDPVVPPVEPIEPAPVVPPVEPIEPEPPIEPVWPDPAPLPLVCAETAALSPIATADVSMILMIFINSLLDRIVRQ